MNLMTDHPKHMRCVSSENEFLNLLRISAFNQGCLCSIFSVYRVQELLWNKANLHYRLSYRLTVVETRINKTLFMTKMLKPFHNKITFF